MLELVIHTLGSFLEVIMKLAGTGGFEPPTYDIKNRCSTAELRPNRNVRQFITIFKAPVNNYVLISCHFLDLSSVKHEARSL